MKIKIRLEKYELKITIFDIVISTITTYKHLWSTSGRVIFENWRSLRYYNRWKKYQKLFYKDAR